MTDYDVMYRGVPVPDSILAPGMFGPNALRDFKMGVDATYDMLLNLDLSERSVTSRAIRPDTPDSEYDYFSDEWIWRYRKGQRLGEYTREYAPGWIESHTPREDVSEAYTQLRELPEWARD
jgi:hypothetical protein